jgi:hypothetical protein
MATRCSRRGAALLLLSLGEVPTALITATCAAGRCSKRAARPSGGLCRDCIRPDQRVRPVCGPMEEPVEEPFLPSATFPAGCAARAIQPRPLKLGAHCALAALATACAALPAPAASQPSLRRLHRWWAIASTVADQVADPVVKAPAAAAKPGGKPAVTKESSVKPSPKPVPKPSPSPPPPPSPVPSPPNTPTEAWAQAPGGCSGAAWGNRFLWSNLCW